MIKRIKDIILIVFTVLMISFNAEAAVPSWQIVPQMSSLTFTATQNNAPVTGQFKSFSGEINFDPNQLSASNIKIVVDMGSVSTSYGDIADTLKTSDWFNTAVFPQAIFTANKFIKTGTNSYQAMGNLTIRDKTQPVSLNFDLDQFTATNAHAKGSLTIKRTVFGVGQGDWKNTDSIKDDVKIDFILTAMRK